MIIRFDAVPLCTEQLTGIGVHEKELTKAIVKLYPENKYEYTYFAGFRNLGLKKHIMEQYSSENCKIKGFPILTAGLYKLIHGILPIPYSWLFRGSPDVTHFFNFLLSPGVKGKKVVTVHDLAFVRYPETVAYRTRKALSMRLAKTVKKADHIFVASDFTGRELSELYGVPSEKMTTVYAGVDRELFKPMEYEECKDVLDSKGLCDRGYFFYLGTIEPRKNIERAVIAYADMKRWLDAEGKDVPPFVFGGKLGWYYDEILERIKSEGIEDKIILAGYLSNHEKACLYARARAFVFPSLYEGFGIPVLEAMACKTPVLTANVSSLPEVTGDKAVLCDPLDASEIAQGLYKLATDDVLCDRLSAEGYERSLMFSWEATAKKMYGVYEEVVKAGK